MAGGVDVAMNLRLVANREGQDFGIVRTWGAACCAPTLERGLVGDLVDG
jgi:hypothetical protein